MIKFRSIFGKCQEKLDQDPAQSRALGHVVKLFLVLLVLTLVARGVSGAAMAQVTLCHPTERTFVEELSTTGILQPKVLVSVELPADLKIAELCFRIGDRVEPGTPLIKFDLQVLEKAILQNQIDQEDLKQELKPLKRSRKAGEQYQAALLEIELTELEEQLAVLTGLREAEGTLVSQETAMVLESSLVSGAATDESSALTLASTSDGFMLEFSMEAEGSSSFFVTLTQGALHQEGTATASGTRDSQGHKIYQVPVKDAGWRLETVKVSATLSQEVYQTCVPHSALHYDSAGAFVYVLQEKRTVLGVENVAKKQSVTVLAQDGEQVAISTSLPLEGMVIASSNKPLSQGDRVRVIP